MSVLNIRVGASIDRSLSVAYRPLIESAQKARAAIEAEGKKAARAISTETKKAEREKADQQKAAEKAAAAERRAVEKAEKDKVRAAEQSAAAMARIRDRSASMAGQYAAKQAAEEARVAKRRAREVEREGRAAARDRARAEHRMGSSVRAGFTRAGQFALGITGAAAGAALGLAGSIARGAGVDTDLDSIFKKNSDLESLATNLSNQGYIAGDKRNGVRIEPKALENQAFDVARATGMDAGDALEGLSKYAGITGDLQTGREILKELAVLAKANGASLEDMVAAAGEVSMQLGDVENKGMAITSLMRTFAGQGKLGAVEIKDLAKYMAKIVSSASQMEGDRVENIQKLGGLAQAARQHGGAHNAAAAADSVAAFVNTMKTPARGAAFKKATGKSMFGAGGQLRDVNEVIIDALRAKGMDPGGFKKIFGNVKGAQPAEAFRSIYMNAGGGDKGEKAVREEMARLQRAAMQDAEVLDSFQAALRTSQSQAAMFNASLQVSAKKIEEVFTPALLNLAPVLTDLASQGAGVLAWMIGNEALEKRRAEKNTKDVDSAITETKKQLANGEIIDGQLGMNKQAEREAFRLRNQLQGDAELKTQQHGDTYDRFMRVSRRANDFSVGGALMNAVFGEKFSGKAANEREEQKLADAQKAAEDAKLRHEEIKALTERTTQLLADGVIKVRVTEPVPSAPGGAPGLKGEGLTPSAEEKARR